MALRARVYRKRRRFWAAEIINTHPVPVVVARLRAYNQGAAVGRAVRAVRLMG